MIEHQRQLLISLTLQSSSVKSVYDRSGKFGQRLVSNLKSATDHLGERCLELSLNISYLF